MEVSDYFEQYVWPNYESFRADPGRKLLAMNAVVAAYHMADWIAACRVGPGVAGGIKDGDVRGAVKQVRKDVLEACPDFALIEDAATAYKHVVTSDKTGGKERPRKRHFMELVRVGTGSRDTRWSDTEAWDASKVWQDHYESVVIDDGKTEHELLLALNHLVAYWGDYVYAGRPDWKERRPEPGAGTGVLR
jgi:hypothetical protein